MKLAWANHPCFNKEAKHKHARIHLPVAPTCNIQCNYCNRKFDCANENRPGVTTTLLSPGQALHYLNRALEFNPSISVVGIAGPGDAFATPEKTMDTFQRVHKHHPELLLCVATNGLNLAPYVSQLADLDLSHVTITMNAIDPEIGKLIYAWVRDNKKVYREYDAARLMLDRQFEAIQLLKEHNLVVKVNSIIIPGINDKHISEMAKYLRMLNVDIMNCIPMYPVEDTPFESIEEPLAERVFSIRQETEKHLPMMSHCTRCRADAIGFLGEQNPKGAALLKESALLPLEPNQNRPYVAVASHEGALINQHLGEAEELWIFQQQENQYELVECRNTPDPGSGVNRWHELADRLKDCRALLVSSAGGSPINVLQEHGIQVHRTDGLIEEALRYVYDGKPLRKPLSEEHRCGTACSGDGLGCN